MCPSSLTAIISSILILILTALYLFFTWTFDYWKKVNVPYLKPAPFFGNLTFFMRKSYADFFRESYFKFPNTKFYGIWTFRRPALVIRAPELARAVLVKDFDYFKDRSWTSGATDPLGALNLLLGKDPLWSKMRKKLTPVFTSAKLRMLHGMIHEYTRELTNRIRREHVQLNKPVDLRDMLGCYTTDVIGAASFGIQCEAVRTNDSFMRRITREIAKFNILRGIEFGSFFFYPSLINLFRFKFYPKGISASFRKIFWKIAEERQKRRISTNRDLMDALLDIRKEAQASGDDLSDDVYVAQAAIFLQGGFDTTSVAISYLFLELTHHPEEMRRLYDEVKMAQDNAVGDLDSSTLSGLHYLNMCIKETMRKYPATPYLDRRAYMDYNLDSKLVIKKGTPVYVNIIGMHYDETFFPDPSTWDPERFSFENEPNIVPFSYMPFGEGPRSCIGIKFAQLVMRTVVVHMLLNFDLKSKPNQRGPKEMPFDANAFFIAPESPIDIQFVDRRI